jgi:hypothetical protein
LKLYREFLFQGFHGSNARMALYRWKLYQCLTVCIFKTEELYVVLRKVYITQFYLKETRYWINDTNYTFDGHVQYCSKPVKEELN